MSANNQKHYPKPYSFIINDIKYSLRVGRVIEEEIEKLGKKPLQRPPNGKLIY